MDPFSRFPFSPGSYHKVNLLLQNGIYQVRHFLRVITVIRIHENHYIRLNFKPLDISHTRETGFTITTLRFIHNESARPYSIDFGMVIGNCY